MKWKKTLKMRAEGRDAKKEREQVRSIKKWGNFFLCSTNVMLSDLRGKC